MGNVKFLPAQLTIWKVCKIHLTITRKVGESLAASCKTNGNKRVLFAAAVVHSDLIADWSTQLITEVFRNELEK